MNTSAAVGSMIGLIVAGDMIREDAHLGWRNYFWLQCALWGATAVGLVFGYRPPTRKTQYDHLTLRQKLAKLDLPGVALVSHLDFFA